MDPVSVLIFNTLARREGINLPGIGSLGIAAEPATMDEPGVVTPPVNRIVYGREENPSYLHVVDLIARLDRTDRDSAQETYNEWLAQVCTEEGVVIESVGRLRDDVFTPSPELSRALNPADTAPVVLSDRVSRRQAALWIVSAVVIGTVLAVGAITMLDRYYQPRASVAPDTPLSEVPAVPLTPALPAAPDTLPDSGASAAAPPVAADSVPVAQEKPAAVAPAPEPASPAPVAGKTYYVIVGAYSTDANAEKFIASAKKKDDTLPFEKLPQPNGRILISIFRSASESEAIRKKRAYEDMFEGAWVYKSGNAR